jgi:hypothetical protein
MTLNPEVEEPKPQMNLKSAFEINHRDTGTRRIQDVRKKINARSFAHWVNIF